MEAMRQDFNKALDQKDWNSRLDEAYDDQRIIDGIVAPIVKELQKPPESIELSNINEMVQPIIAALSQNNEVVRTARNEQRTLFNTIKDGLDKLLRRDVTKDIEKSINKQTRSIEALVETIRNQKSIQPSDLDKLAKSVPQQKDWKELSDMVKLLEKIEGELKKDKKPNAVLTTPKIQDQFQRSNGERVAALVDTDNHLQVDIQTMPSSDPAEVREISLYAVNDMSDMVSNITYVGREKDNGSWCVVKMDETSGTSMLYATVANNAGITTYADAWTGRAGLTYNYYSVAF